jgi:hypothetical protein
MVVSMPRKIPEERRSRLCRRGSLIFFDYFEDEDLVSQTSENIHKTRWDQIPEERSEDIRPRNFFKYEFMGLCA